jgi:hypothetical protein
MGQLHNVSLLRLEGLLARWNITRQMFIK